MIDAQTINSNVVKFLNDTMDARVESELARDFYDGHQLTEHEEETLKKRRQVPVVINKVKPKVEGFVGLYDIRKSDIKAYPRTQAHSESGELVTDALRFVSQRNNFDQLKLDVAEDFYIEGYGGAIVQIKKDKTGEPWVDIKQIPWDRIYFDPHSRRKDFSDARYIGMMMWAQREEFLEMFPEKGDQFDGVIAREDIKGQNPNKTIDQAADTNDFSDDTFEDRPKFVDKQNDRLRMAVHFEKYKSQWHMACMIGGEFVIEPMVSPYLDDEGDPCCPIELVSAYIDRDNNRYGEVKHMIPMQREINSRRSKFLFFLSQRQTYGRKGDAEDTAKIKRELAKPDGHIEFDGDEWGKDFGVIPNADMSNAQLNLYLDSKQEMAATSHQANLAEANRENTLSGRALARLQQADTIEVNRQYSRLKHWESRIYRQILGRVKQYWTKEKWIRVTDDNDKLRWVGFNTPITVQERLEEVINDEAEEYFTRREAATIYTQMIQARDPRLAETVEIRNPLPELDVDLILDQSFDVVNMEEEQFQMMAQFGANSGIDIIDLLEVSQVRNKDELIEKIQNRRQEAAQAAGSAAQLEAQGKAADIENTQADTAVKATKAQQQNLENELLIAAPTAVTSVAI